MGDCTTYQLDDGIATITMDDGKVNVLSSQSLYAAQESAIESLHSKAKLLAADGVIDVKVIERANVWTSNVIEFVAYGTAIKGTQAQRQPIDPQIVVLLNDVQSPTSQVQGASTFR